MKDYLSPLELLHPDGVARRWIAVGGNHPELLLPAGATEPTGSVDLALLAPTANESTARHWLERAVDSCVERLGVDGFLYALVPRQARATVRASLLRHGLVVEPPFAHIPNWNSSQYLLPLASPVAEFAFARVIHTKRWKRTVALALARTPGGLQLIGTAFPWVGLAARRGEGRALFDWLTPRGTTPDDKRSAFVRTSWRGREGAVIIYGFSNSGGLPSIVAKASLSTAFDPADESRNLRDIGQSARAAGARVPQPVELKRLGGRSVLLETPVLGSTLAVVLGSRPDRVADLLGEVVRWLEAWNGVTVKRAPLSDARLQRDVLSPAAFLAPLLERGDEYRIRLEQLCAGVAGTTVPLVHTHNDLTMWNVLRDERGRLGVLDWEGARRHDLPLLDFFYATTDAWAALRKYDDRLAAFEACFGASGEPPSVVSSLYEYFVRAMEVPRPVVELCLHACWVRHAEKECRSRGRAADPAFLQIVQSLAFRRPVAPR